MTIFNFLEDEKPPFNGDYWLAVRDEYGEGEVIKAYYTTTDEGKDDWGEIDGEPIMWAEIEPPELPDDFPQ